MSGEPLPIYDLERMLRELYEEIPQPRTMTVRFDGVFAEGEPDHDEGPLAVGDRVRISYAGLLGIEGTRPHYHGTVLSVDPWHPQLAGKVFVHPDHLPNPEHGAWWERERLSRIPEETDEPA